MQRCFSDLVSQPLVTSYVINVYLFGHVAPLDPGVPAHGVLRLMVKAERQWPAGEDHRATLAMSGSTRFRRMPMPYSYLCYGDLRSPGVMEWRNGPLGLRDDDDDLV